MGAGRTALIVAAFSAVALAAIACTDDAPRADCADLDRHADPDIDARETRPQSRSRSTSSRCTSWLSSLAFAFEQASRSTHRCSTTSSARLVTLADAIATQPDTVARMDAVAFSQASADARTLMSAVRYDAGDGQALDAARAAAQRGLDAASRYFTRVAEQTAAS